MSEKEKYNLDYFDGAESPRRTQKRRQPAPQSRPKKPSANRNPVRPPASRTGAGRRKNGKRTRNRIIIVLVGILIVAGFVALLVVAFKGCSTPERNTAASVSTETISADA